MTTFVRRGPERKHPIVGADLRESTLLLGTDIRKSTIRIGADLRESTLLMGADLRESAHWFVTCMF